MTVLRKNSTTTTRQSPLDFVMSDGTVDRNGDIVTASGWRLDKFKSNPVALVGHDQNFIAGRWTHVRVERNALRGHLQLAPAGTSQRIDEIRALVHAGFMPGCSVGFLPIKQTPRNGGKGVVYLEQELVECSLTAVPANSNAVLERVKALGISTATINKVFLQPPVNGSIAQRSAHAQALLARANAALAKVDDINRRRRARSLTSKRDDYDDLTPEQIAALETVRIEEQKARIANNYSHNKSTSFGDSQPEVFFGHKPMFNKKNKWGW